MYYYDRYETDEEYGKAGWGVGVSLGERDELTYYDSYHVDPETGEITLGKRKTIRPGDSDLVYSSVGNSTVVVYTFQHSSREAVYYDAEVRLYKVKGSFRETIVAEDRAYPNDGIQGNYWYVKKDIAGLNLYPRIGGQVKQVESGKVRIDGELKDILGIWTRIDGKLKEV